MATRHPEHLLLALDHIEHEEHELAAATLREAIALARADTDPRAIRHLVFAQALLARDAHPASPLARRLTTRSPFDALASHLPTHALALALCNAYILSACDARRRVHLLDIGIGTGRQVVDLIGALSARELEVDDLVVVGVDPHGPSLDSARAQIYLAAERVGIPCQFHAIELPIERVTPIQWASLSALLDRPAVNASFSLHRVHDHPEYDTRDHVLSRVRALDPSVIVLAEHDVDHATTDLRARLTHCWRHYGALFDLLDRVDLSPDARDALAHHHFGRAIRDVLAHDSPTRALRHEPTISWARRLRRADFAPSRLAITLPRHALLDVRLHHDHVALSLHDQPLVSTLAWEPSLNTRPSPPPLHPGT